MSDSAATFTTEWGVFTQASTTLTDGEVLLHNWFELEGEPVIMIQAVDAATGAALAAGLTPFFAEQEAWTRRAAAAVVTEFTEEELSVEQVGAQSADYEVTTLEMLPNGDIVLHFEDMGELFEEGYWPAVSVGPDGTVTDVSVEA